MLKKVFTIVLLIVATNVFAQNQNQNQDPRVLNLSSVKTVNYFLDLAQPALLSAPKTSSIQSVATKKFITDKQKVSLTQNSAYWFQAFVNNDEEVDQRFYIYCGYNDYAELYVAKSIGFHFLGKTGRLVPTPNLQHPNSSKYLSFYIPAKTQLQLYLKIYNRGNQHVDFGLTIEDKTTYQQELLSYYQSVVKSVTISLLFIGSLGFIFLFMLFLYFKSYQKIYLYYSLYLLGAIIYALTRIKEVTWIGSLVDHYPLIRECIREPIQFAFFAVYNYFVIALLNIDTYDQRLVKFLKRLSVVYLIYGVLHFALTFAFFDFQLLKTSFIISRSVLFPLNVLLIIWVYLKVKSPILPYFLLGAFCYLSAGLIAAMVDFRFKFIDLVAIGIPPSNIFELGILAEVLCFSLAVGYRIKLNEDEKKVNQLELIKQLQINQKLIENTNEALELEVRIRSKKLIEISKEIEAKNIAAIKLDYDKKLAEAEMMALRSQMNPHFIFNSLNSVRYFMLSKQTEKAVDYLNKFSRLMRLVLEHSKNEVITLEQELAALALYLDIEANRFSGQFKYEINVDPDIEISNIQIPPLLFQPFVENAIWHGLLQSDKESKEVMIDVEKLADGLPGCLIVVSDNGIGFEKSAEIKISNKSENKSMGISLTQERIKLFNDNSPNNITYTVENITEANKVAGTKVIFTLKLSN